MAIGSISSPASGGTAALGLAEAELVPESHRNHRNVGTWGQGTGIS